MLNVEHISKRYDNAPLLRDISFEVGAGEILCLLGPSGTGKTTLLRIIAGLETADAGRVLFDGKDLQGVPPHERGFGLMFQDLALFPHKNVFDNVAFGLRMQNLDAGDISERVNEALELVGLDAARFAKRDVNRLSGGEQQRVALARTLAPRPRLIMFDEPLGALDRILREELVEELRALLKRLELTALYVTHDQDEAFAIADRLAILNARRIEQMGTPKETFDHPATAFVARFLGLTNLIPASNVKRETSNVKGEASNVIAETAVGTFVTAVSNNDEIEDGFVLLRPRAVERIVENSERAENVLRGRIVETVLRGGHQRILVETSAGTFAFEWDAPVILNRQVAVELAQEEISFLKG